MFKSNKKPSLQIPDNFGEGFIRTMNDDLNPSLKKIPIPSPQSQPNPFLNQTQIPQSQTNSPFMAATQPTQQSPAAQATAPVSQAAAQPGTSLSQQNIPKEKIYANERSSEKSSGRFKLLTIITILLLLLLALLGGLYYAWSSGMLGSNDTMNAEEDLLEETLAQDAVNTAESIPEDNAQITISPMLDKYSIETPNTLQINIEEMTADDIKNKIINTALEAGQIQSLKPIEFVIKDKNNNPVAFPIFAAPAAINLPSTLLTNLEEDFSIFVFNDNGNIRLALSIQTKDIEAVYQEMIKAEADIISTLSFIYLNEQVLQTQTSYNDGIYKDTKKRYLSLSSEKDLSMDYGIHQNKLIISTSKKTFEAVVDKITSDELTQVKN